MEEEQGKNGINELTTRAIPTHSPRSPQRSRERQIFDRKHICGQEKTQRRVPVSSLALVPAPLSCFSPRNPRWRLTTFF